MGGVTRKSERYLKDYQYSCGHNIYRSIFVNCGARVEQVTESQV